MTREEIFKKYGKSKDNLLYIMHDVQDNNPRHYLSEEDLKEVANWLGLSYSYVHGVATFYSMYSLKPRGKYIIRVCESPTCHLMGSSDIILELVKHLGVGIGETTKDELFTLELTSCIGVCGVAPAMMINNEAYGNLTPERIAQIIEEKRREAR
ncbi:MAG TPA: NADH-quinone oxidoreductase subunit NuoE [Candidatus Hydrothermia bacterium]|nr:NADH-quinone oxidoreductase subunit NuoE [Candidatus Hydrothermae bacterium]MDD3648572.1 NADH-quinone oxidoreductase subunit NuoE [Candidatus Hydrothermia bacterium]MDD5572686.1 NADH-quinone oxidoreductase subunit NuoE [Candidatus Hydrothermia bacterium]HOK22568.1 NADH-quinone oxidoreductase subunit NuoE [Candidatus Hydrothermia bacterium]HOL23275.1 NADH-quinone oxidoreductase subunit NuoE [Candidatus Hydrothermia bacterium]